MRQMQSSMAVGALVLGLAGGCVGNRGGGGDGVGGGAGSENRTTKNLPATIQPDLELPQSARADAALEPLSFMAGRWIGVNPNKTVNEEHWMTPRGNHMLGTFKQIRRDGKPALVEISLITINEGKVKLVLRHLHSNLEVPEKRRELSEFELKSAGGNRAEFGGVGASAAVTSVVYKLVSPDVLEQTLTFAPDSKEKGYTLTYTREK